jgi:hypothetical protein
VVEQFVLCLHDQRDVRELDRAVIADRLAGQTLGVRGRESAHVLDQQLECACIDLHGLPRIGAHPLTRHLFDQLTPLVAIG